MSHERTIREFRRDVERATGVKVRQRWGGPYIKWFLEDVETGSQYALGERHVLSPEEQESICRKLYRREWIVLLGLGPPEDDGD